MVARCCDHADEGSDLVCQKQLWFGGKMAEDEAMHRMKLWLMKGTEIPIDHPLGKKRHLNINPRHFKLAVEKSEAQLDAEASMLDPFA